MILTTALDNLIDRAAAVCLQILPAQCRISLTPRLCFLFLCGMIIGKSPQGPKCRESECRGAGVKGLGHWAISCNLPVSAGPACLSHILLSDDGVCTHLTLRPYRTVNHNTWTSLSCVGHRVTSWQWSSFQFLQKLELRA